jgi:hypothetical protein
MAKGDQNQINLKPHFKEKGDTSPLRLPCEGEAGDLYVFTTLGEGDLDPNPQAPAASLWFCIKGAEADGRNAIWARVQYDTKTTCAVPPPKPPNIPELKDG